MPLQVGRTTYTFDANGNQQIVLEPSGNRTTNTWDFENRNTKIALPTGILNTMTYNADGLRVSKQEAPSGIFDGTWKYIWDGRNYLMETNAAGVTQRIYTNEPGEFGNLVSMNWHFIIWQLTLNYHYDALGSTRALTNSSEVVDNTYIYTAFGETVAAAGSVPNPFQFVGEQGYYYDNDTSDYYVRARIYGPLIALVVARSFLAGRWSESAHVRLEQSCYYCRSKRARATFKWHCCRRPVATSNSLSGFIVGRRREYRIRPKRMPMQFTAYCSQHEFSRIV